MVQGRLYHRLGPLFPGGGQRGAAEQPEFLQLYVHDPHAADQGTRAMRRMRGMSFGSHASAADRTLAVQLLMDLERILRACNPYVQDLVTAGEIMRSSDVEEAQFVISRDARPQHAHERRYHPPNGGPVREFQEVCVLVGEGTAGGGLQLRRRDGGLHMIDHLHRAFDALHFVLLFPMGDDSWRIDLPRHSLTPIAHGMRGRARQREQVRVLPLCSV